MRAAFAVLMITLVMLALGCGKKESGDSSAGTSGTKPDIIGEVKKIETVKGDGTDVIGRLLIEGSRKGNTAVDRATVTVTNKTRILEQVGNDLKPSKLSSIVVGQPVEARFTGPVAESYPVQAAAGEIVILRY